MASCLGGETVAMDLRTKKINFFLKKIKNIPEKVNFLNSIFGMFRDCFAHISAIFHTIDLNSGAY